MKIRDDFTVRIFTPDLSRSKPIGGYLSASPTFRHLAMSDATMVFRSSDPDLELIRKGTSVQMIWTRNRLGSGRPEDNTVAGGPWIFAGRVRTMRGDVLGEGTVTVEIQGAWRVLRNTLAWVRADRALQVGALTDEGQSSLIAGMPAPPSGEDAGRSGYTPLPTTMPDWGVQEYVRYLWAQNVLGRVNPWIAGNGPQYVQVQDDSGLPPIPLTPLPQLRFPTLEEAIVPHLRAANLSLVFNFGFYADQRPGDIEAYIRRTVEWPQVFTPETGIVAGGEWAQQEADATHVVVGGPGEASARFFYGADTADHSDFIEVFRDATGAPVSWPSSVGDSTQVAKYYLLRGEVGAAEKAEFLAEIEAAAEAVFAEAAATSSLSVELAESEGFYIGSGGVQLGDRVRIATSKSQLGTDETFTTALTEVTVTHSPSGLTVNPQWGERIDDPDEDLARTVAAIAARVRRGSTSR